MLLMVRVRALVPPLLMLVGLIAAVMVGTVKVVGVVVVLEVTVGNQSMLPQPDKKRKTKSSGQFFRVM